MRLLSLTGLQVSRFRPLHLLVLLGVCASWACDKVPLTSPTGSTISLSTNSNIVPINGSVQITATVTESAGTAVQNGTTVVFTSDFGRMDPAEARTQNGRATVRFVASGQSGTVKINAFSGAASTSGGATSGALTLLVGGAAAARISVRAEPPTIPQAGGTIQIYAVVSDTNGNPLAGAPVLFTVSGTTGSGILGSSSGVTDANGQAQTSLTTTQTTTVTATVASTTTAAVSGTVTVFVLAAPTITIGCTAPGAGFSVGVAVNCTVTPTVTSGGSPIQNVTVNWGDGSGEISTGNVTGATVVSHTYLNPNTYAVTATATDLNGQRGTAVVAVVVGRILPSVVLTVPASGTAGIPVVMSIAPGTNQTQTITSVTVDFGDGTTRTFGALTATQGFTKTYATAGGYTVTARATDASGQVGSTSGAIVISASQPTVTLVANTTPDADGYKPNTNVVFTVTATATAGTAITSVEVRNLSDGNKLLYSSTSSGSFTAQFPVGSGANNLEARVVDSAGGVGIARLTIIQK